MSNAPMDLAERFARDGYYVPLSAVSVSQAQYIADDLKRLEKQHGAEDLYKRTKLKPHLLIKSLNELVRAAQILDAVEVVLGPDILVWGVGIFIKRARDPGFYAWHQDATYWGLSEPALVTAWVALTPSNPANGCMRVVPGSHLKSHIPHRERAGSGNLLSRGQEIAVEVNEAQAVDLILNPGQMSLHHVMTVHGSEPNHSDVPRIGIGIRYIAARVEHAAGFEDSATLVRGSDSFGHYILEPEPRGDFDPECVALYGRIVAQSRARALQEAESLRS